MEPNHSPAYLIIKVKASKVDLVFHDGNFSVVSRGQKIETLILACA